MTQEIIPTVSILIPTYNRELFLAECIQSALDQTFTDFEIVICDNVSTDESWMICQDFAARHSNIRIFQNETNVGPVRNWLRCIEEARGKYIKILFSDDMMLPNFLEHTVPLLEDDDIGFVSTAAIVGTSPQEGREFYISPEDNVAIFTSTYLDFLIDGIAPYSPCAALFRVEDVKENLLTTFPTRKHLDFCKNGAGPDVLLYTLTAITYKKVAMLRECCIFFRSHAQSISVCNEDNEVTRNYRSALGWFFRERVSREYWLKYVAASWVKDMRHRRRWVPLQQYCAKFDGVGSIAEVIGIIRASSRKMLLWLFNRVMFNKS